MKNNVICYRLFVVDRIFSYESGCGITKEEIDNNPGSLNAVQSGECNNGILGKISLEYVKSMDYKYTLKPCLTVARTGSSGYVSFQPEGCVVGDSAKLMLLPDKVASTYVYLYLQTVLTHNRFKYAYGRKVTEKNYFSDYISLPIKTDEKGLPLFDDNKEFSEEGYIPNWEYMTSYIKEMRSKPIGTLNTVKSSELLDVSQWQYFRLGDIIHPLTKGHAYTKEDLDQQKSCKGEMTLPYITRTAEDNGCEFRTSMEGLDYIEEGNAITIGDTTATCFYQKEKFITGDHMVILRADWLNEKTGLFLLSVLNKEKYKYSYGRAFVIEKIENTLLPLPVACDEVGRPIIDINYQYSKEGYVPDWNYMERYIMSLPYGDRL